MLVFLFFLIICLTKENSSIACNSKKNSLKFSPATIRNSNSSSAIFDFKKFRGK